MRRSGVKLVCRVLHGSVPTRTRMVNVAVRACADSAKMNHWNECSEPALQPFARTLNNIISKYMSNASQHHMQC